MNLLKKYNKKDSLVVISSYPKRSETYSKGVCAVASFTKNTIDSLKKTGGFRKIIVLTMVIDKEEIYEENDVLVVRCFKRNNPSTYINLFKKLRQFSQVNKVLIEFEFASFGDTKSTLAMLPLIWAIYLYGKKVTLVIHQVVLDLKKLSGHIGISSNLIISYLFNPALKLFYKLVSFPVSSIVVLEDNLKTSLSKIVNQKKIIVIPHGVPKVKKTLTKKSARKQLGLVDEHVILYFGYLTWYKGIDFLIKTFLTRKKINGKKVKLIIAGGISFTQERKPHYQKYIMMIQNLVKNLPSNIEITGFVDEKKIPLYFIASDLVVFPYRTFLSSSGPLSFTLAYKKPFLLSENLAKLLESEDIKKCINRSGLAKEELLFKFNQKDLIFKTKKSLERKQNLRLEKFSRILASERSFDKLSESYSSVLNSQEEFSKKLWFLPRFNYRLPV